MEKRLDDLQQRLQSCTNNTWCKTLSYELNRLSCLSHKLPIYQTQLKHKQLIDSIRRIQDLHMNVTSNDLYVQALKNYLLLISIHTHKLVCEIFLDQIRSLKLDLHYWKHVHQTYSSIVDQIKTTFWFDSEQDDIGSVDKVKFLDKQEYYLSNVIGRLAYAITNLEEQEKINLDSIMNYTNELYQTLFDITPINYNTNSDLSDVIESYFQILNSFEEFKLRWMKKVYLYRRPTHVKRYLPYYLGLTVIGTFTAYQIYANRQQIINYVYSSYDSLHFFINEHLIVPLKTIYSSTFESRSSLETLENSQQNYLNSKKILEEMLEEYGRQHAGTLAKVNNTTVEEFLSTLSDRAKNEDMNVVMKHYQQELDKPIRSALLGDLIKGILIQVQKVKVDGEGLVIQIDQLMRQNQINFSLLATIPAVLLITFLTVSTKNIVANRLIKQRKYDFATLRQQIICKTRELEHLLIFNSEFPARTINGSDLITIDKDCHEHSNQQGLMSYKTYGRFLSLIHELKYFADQLNSRRMLSKEFNEDINLLTYTQFSTQQKLLFIQQICHSYSFLVHY